MFEKSYVYHPRTLRLPEQFLIPDARQCRRCRMVQSAAWSVLATSYIHSLIVSALGGFASKLRLGEDNATVYEITATRGQNAGPDASPTDSSEPDSRKRYRRNGRNRDLLGRIRFSRRRRYGS